MLIKSEDEILSTMEQRYERELQEMGDRISLQRYTEIAQLDEAILSELV